MTSQFTIVYISPNGATGKVAETFADQLAADGAPVAVLDLSDTGAIRSVAAGIQAGEASCLLLGSPVYRDMAVPPVMAFIDSLPPCHGAWAVPFVTYGRACSGVALWQMAGALQAKGFRIAGAAKVVALHSMMWTADRPAGAGHPDLDDLALVRRLAATLSSRIAASDVAPLPLETFDYQSAERTREFKAKIAQPWVIIPKSVDANACTECGTCAEVCPVGAIDLDPLPVFADTCFDCFNCIRLCPEAAIEPAVPLEKITAMIQERVRTIDEQPLTQVFLSES